MTGGVSGRSARSVMEAGVGSTQGRMVTRWSRGGHLWFQCVAVVLLLVGRISAKPSFTFPDARQASFAQSLNKFDIIVPQRVNYHGEFISHNVHHLLDDSRARAHVHRRDVSDDVYRHYKVNVEGKDLHVTLKPNHKLFGPGLVAEWRDSRYGNVSGSRIKAMRKNKCHFEGEIRGHPRSRAAITTCNGLTGMLHTTHSEYFIEPVKGHPYGNGTEHPHMIYKRSAIPPETNVREAPGKEQMTCGVGESHVDVEREREKLDQQQRGDSIGSGKHHRRKRSVSLERNVETLVVVDKQMMLYYKDEDIETYVLTIMNMVSTMYHDSTIGNAVNIVLVHLIFLEENDENLHITHHADNTLNSFCKWQHSLNPKDEGHPNHHDVAVLLTRYNICSRMNEPCSTLGLSQVAGMCQPHRSCNINEDTGLVLAYTVAHEIGHNFGMKHDTDRNGCTPVAGEFQHVMSPQLSANSNPLVWSNCSRQAVTKFLDRDWGYCLDDEPSQHEFEFPEMPPGVMYDVNHQCRLQYGPEAVYCEGIDELCATLWCQVDNRCLTRLEAAAEGTLCGENQWCEGGQCVTIGERPEAIDGNWGEWGEWSSCTRTCGAGVSVAERHCHNPAPSNGGKYCLHERKRYRICETEDCEDDAVSFRQKQCSDFNKIPYKRETHRWESFTNTINPCQLHCKPKAKYFSVMLKDMVSDGTPCRPGTKDMCINGLCRHVGCDWVIDSSATEDQCGVCHGDGTSCTTVKKEFKKAIGLGYVEATVIPAGARNIRVEEVAEANNYLAVRNSRGKFYLNGHWVIQWSGDFEAGGTVIHYERVGNKESFNATGPLKEPLHFMLLFQSQNPGVIFEYTVPNENLTARRKPEFYWKHLDWTHCTSSCGGGHQRSEVVCYEREAGHVDLSYCNASIKEDDEARSCNVHQCPAKWWVGPWQHCSVTCGNGTHLRTVICVRSLGPDEQLALDDEKCNPLQKPSNIEPCHHKQPCRSATGQAQWRVGAWSKSCMGDPCDSQTRKVKCSDHNAICDAYNKPPTRRYCSNTTCGKWLPAAWSKCTRTCGGGIQMRGVKCVGGQDCHRNRMPRFERDCNVGPCPPVSTTTKHLPTSTKGPPSEINNDIGRGAGQNDVDTRDPYRSKTDRRPPPKRNLYSPDNEVNKVYGQTRGNTNVKTRPDQTTLDNGDKSVEDAPTDTSIMSTPFRFLTKWLGLGEADQTNEKEERSQDPEEKQNLDASGKHATRQHKWVYASPVWGDCSRPCGGGERRRETVCVQIDSRQTVEPALCQGQLQPVNKQPCNSQACLQWQTSQWSKCSKTCGADLRRRQVRCPEVNRCDPSKKPVPTEPCNNHRPCTDWVAGQWSQCSQSCGSGEQVRMVQCINQETMQPATGCKPAVQPATGQACNTEPCPAHSAALSRFRQTECRSNIMSYKVCRELEKMGQCQNRYVQNRCCKTCQPRPRPRNNNPPAT